MYQPTEDVVSFITTYMNENQVEALLAIARHHDTGVESARLTTLDGVGFTLEVSSAAGEDAERRITIDWPAPLRHREDVRAHLANLQNEARLTALRERHLRRQQAPPR